MYKEIAIYRKRSWDFHIYHDKTTNTLKYKINDDPELAYNQLEYLIIYKILRIKNRYKRAAGMRYKDINIKYRGKRVFGFIIDNVIIHKIIIHALDGDDVDGLYTYENYLKHMNIIKGKRGLVVRKCNECDDAILLGSILGKGVGSFRRFMMIRQAMRDARKKAGHKDVGFCYAITEKEYFIYNFNRKFVCRDCITGKFYKSGYYAQE